MGNKSTKKVKLRTNSKLNVIMLTLVLVALTVVINTTVAWFAFSNKGDAELTLATVKLDTNISMTEDLSEVVPNMPIITSAEFSKSEEAIECFVRAKVEYFTNAESLTRNQQNYILILNSFDYTSKLDSAVEGSKWVKNSDGFYYLVDDAGEFIKITDNTTYKFLKEGEEIVYPVTLGSIKYPEHDMNVSDLHVNLEFQAVQGTYLPSEKFEDIVSIFELCFPDDVLSEVLVSFDTLGGSKIEGKVVNVGNKITMPTAPTKSGTTFEGWYLDSEYTTEFDFKTMTIDGFTTLYAKWQTENTFSDGLVFSEGKVVGYVGNDIRVVVPSSYSLTGERQTISQNISTVTELEQWAMKISPIMEFGVDVYPVTIDDGENVYSANTMDEMGTMFEGVDIENLNYPVTASYSLEEFVEGNDYNVTEIAPGAFAGMDVYFSIFGYGVMPDNMIKEIVLPEGITTIGESAFIYQMGLSTINIPSTVTSIDDNCFTYCLGLRSINLPSSLTTYSSAALAYSFVVEVVNNSTSVSNDSITLDESISGDNQIINSTADSRMYVYDDGENVWQFYVGTDGTYLVNIDCTIDSVTTPRAGVVLKGLYDESKTTSLSNYKVHNCFFTTAKEIKLSNNVTEILDSGFGYSTNLENFETNNVMTAISANSFMACFNLKSVTIGDSITTLEAGLFETCSKLESIKIGKGLTTIEAATFDNTNLNTIVFSNGVTSIADNLFKDFTSVESVTLPNSLKTIGIGAFSGCYRLKEIDIPSSVTSIGASAFYDCESIKSIDLSDNNITQIADNTFEDCSFLESVQLPNSVTSIGARAFSWTAIKEIQLPNRLTTLGDYAFSGCDFKSVTLSNTITNLGDGVFSSCDCLENVTIQNGVTTLTQSLFSDCTALTTITLPSSVTSIKEYTFSFCDKLLEVINHTSIENIQTYIPSALNIITNTADSKLYKYVDSKETWYFYIDSNVAYLIDYENGHGDVATPTSGVTLIGKYDSTKTVTLGNYDLFKSALYGSSFTSLIVSEGVVSIEYEALYDMFYLISIVFPSTLQSINDRAFYGYALAEIVDLSSLNIQPRSLYSSYIRYENVIHDIDDSGLYKYNDGTNVWYFYEVDGKMTLAGGEEPEHLVTPDAGVILTKVYDNTITKTLGQYSIGFGAYYAKYIYSVTLSDSVIGVDVAAFTYCMYNESVTLSNNLTYISESAFTINGIKEIYIPDSVTYIDHAAFQYCQKLENVRMSSNIEYIGYKVFDSTKFLDNIDFDGYFKTMSVDGREDKILLKVNNNLYNATADTFDGIFLIAGGAFEGCTSLQTIELPDINISTMGLFRDCTNLTTVTLSNTITEIGDYMFDGCSNLVTVNNMSNITRIGENAFQDCTSLETITLPEGLQSIEYSAFYNCSKLTSITIPSSVTTTGSAAFNSCTLLTTIIVECDTLVSDEKLYWFEESVEYILCKNGSVADKLITNGHTNTTVYVKTELDSSLTFTDVEGVVNGTATDTSGYKWVRIGDAQSGYTYYKCKAIAS